MTLRSAAELSKLTALTARYAAPCFSRRRRSRARSTTSLKIRPMKIVDAAQACLVAAAAIECHLGAKSPSLRAASPGSMRARRQRAPLEAAECASAVIGCGLSYGVETYSASIGSLA